MAVSPLTSKFQACIPGTGNCSDVVGPASWHAELGQIGLGRFPAALAGETGAGLLGKCRESRMCLSGLCGMALGLPKEASPRWSRPREEGLARGRRRHLRVGILPGLGCPQPPFIYSISHSSNTWSLGHVLGTQWQARLGICLCVAGGVIENTQCAGYLEVASSGALVPREGA